jgi:hypothetical protein
VYEGDWLALRSSCFTPNKEESLLPTEYEVEWTPRRIWVFWRRDKLVTSAGVQTRDHPGRCVSPPWCYYCCFCLCWALAVPSPSNKVSVTVGIVVCPLTCPHSQLALVLLQKLVARAEAPPALAPIMKLTVMSTAIAIHGYWVCIFPVFVAHLLFSAIPLNVFHTKPWYLYWGRGGRGAVE